MMYAMNAMGSPDAAGHQSEENPAIIQCHPADPFDGRRREPWCLSFRTGGL